MLLQNSFLSPSLMNYVIAQASNEFFSYFIQRLFFTTRNYDLKTMKRKSMIVMYELQMGKSRN
jgi:hypothetical protein